MSKKVYFKNLREGRKALTDLGVDPGFMSLKDMATSYEQELKRRASSSKITAAVVTASKAANNVIGELRAAVKSEKDYSRKADLLSQLTRHLSAELAKEKDAVRATEIQRDFMQAGKQEAYNLLALKTLDPAAFKARRLAAFADRE